MSHKQKQRRRNRLWSIDPQCYWCGCATILPSREPKQKYQPDNMATIDHLRSRLDSDRQVPSVHTDPPRTVLSCKKCNERRGFEKERDLSEGDLQARAKNGHRNKNFFLTNNLTYGKMFP